MRLTILAQGDKCWGGEKSENVTLFCLHLFIQKTKTKTNRPIIYRYSDIGLVILINFATSRFATLSTSKELVFYRPHTNESEECLCLHCEKCQLEEVLCLFK